MALSPVPCVDATWRSMLRERSKQRSIGAEIGVVSSIRMGLSETSLHEDQSVRRPVCTKTSLYEDQSARKLLWIKTSDSRAKLVPGIQFIAPPDSQFF